MNKEEIIKYLEDELKRVRHEAEIEMIVDSNSKRLSYLSGRVCTYKEILNKVKGK